MAHVGILYRSQDAKLIFDEPLVDLRLFHIMLGNDVFYCTLVQSTLLSPLLAGGKVELTGSKEYWEGSSYGAQSACSRLLGNADWMPLLGAAIRRTVPPRSWDGMCSMSLMPAFQRDLEVLLFEEFIFWVFPFFPLLLVLFCRYLHQSGTLTMDALEDPPPEPVECPEEDIADKVGAVCES